MNNKTVSVIIPVHNVASYLEEAIESVINQTYNNLEIIIIDDGSTDESGQICDNYACKDSRIQVVHQENRGLSAARNCGLDMMTGYAVAFLDSDDAYHPDFIRIMIESMDCNDVDLVVCQYTCHHTCKKMVLKAGDNTTPSISFGVHDRIVALNALADGSIKSNVWNKLYKRYLWEMMRFPEGHVYEDIDTIYKIVFRCESVCVINELLYMHRIHAESISNKCSPESIRDWLIASFNFDSFIERNIPCIFNQKQLNRKRQSMLGQMIFFYSRIQCEKRNNAEDLKQSLKSKIFELYNEVGFGNIYLDQRIAYS